MARSVNTHLTAVDGAQLRNFGYETQATEAALFAITGNPGEIQYVTPTGRLYQYSTLDSEWVIWGGGGSSWLEAARVASTANVNIAAPGAAIDGVTLVAGVDRVLLKDQTLPAENGVYVFNGAAAPMTRVTDLDSDAETSAATLFVTEGATNADTQFQQTADGATIGTDPLTFSLVGPATGVATATDAVAGISELSTDAEAIAGTDTTRNITPANLAAVLGDKGGTALFGDGAATGAAFAHGVTGLAATDDLIIQVTDEATGFKVDVDIGNDATNITWAAVAAPALNAYRATWWSAA